MSGYSDPEPLGATYGPGTPVSTCLTCGALVLPEHQPLHTEWHGGTDG